MATRLWRVWGDSHGRLSPLLIAGLHVRCLRWPGTSGDDPDIASGGSGDDCSLCPQHRLGWPGTATRARRLRWPPNRSDSGGGWTKTALWTKLRADPGRWIDLPVSATRRRL